MNIIQKIGIKLAKLGSGDVYLVVVDQGMVKQAKVICKEIETETPDGSIESKRHRAFSKLLRLYPNSPADCFTAIDLALR